MSRVNKYVSCKSCISYIEVCICISIFSILPFIYPVSIVEDNVAEWLRRLPAKQFPFGSVGSNPAVVVFCLDGVEYEEKWDKFL